MSQTPDIQSGRLSRQQLEQNFEDIHPPLDSGNAMLEAQRCYYCFEVLVVVVVGRVLVLQIGTSHRLV